ncbi:hypothetical protein EJB05_29581, partial [Eragrostis curvula]
MFKKVKTTWVSHLPKACYVWNWTGSSSSSSSSSSGWFKGGTFEDLTLLHISYCPRIVQVIHFPIVSHALDRLETLEITWCGDVSVAFHGYDLPRRFRAWQFPKLKHIRLHELPKLQKICNFASRIMTPELQTIKIRGCWSLRTLPVVRTGDPWWGTILPTVESGNAVECNCEKKWWDMLEWESEAHASHYKPIHPRHYKKTMLRGSVLREEKREEGAGSRCGPHYSGSTRRNRAATRLWRTRHVHAARKQLSAVLSPLGVSAGAGDGMGMRVLRGRARIVPRGRQNAARVGGGGGGAREQRKGKGERAG